MEKKAPVVSYATRSWGYRQDSPLLVVLALGVSLHVVLALEPFGAFQAEVSTQTGQFLYILRALVLLQVTGRLDIGEDLVIVSVKRLTSETQQRHTLYNAEGRRTWCDAYS